MAVGIPGFSSLAAGPEAPLELLSACHERMGRQCATLRRLAAHVAAHGADAAAQTAAASVLRYFDTAAVHHHRDEEEDLFPALIESMAGSDAFCLHALVDGLTQEHRQLEAAWRRLHGPLQAVGEGRPADLGVEQVEAFCKLYAAHIQREEDELLPMAARLLDDHALADMSRAMRARRGGEAG
ncbi:hemerythrin domain-containing protein [Bordetella petrii]|uniref:hemerythrin domain-containing protein n=1 Tax=Bordetella petrii TaxID=94624 RepID=UPI001A976E50|nr:hemerythrin domain-containing protein [Bordetella petrii]MBO1112453.1 hemerythrin domain-containing protein [Bordetella petrii]